jgi:sugar lactone lactonase YvrE
MVVTPRLVWVLALAAAGGCGDEESHCDDPGQACTWAGKPGVFGFNGDGHDKLDTELYWTMDMAFAPDGTAWFIDWNNHQVRHVLADHTVQTVVGWTDPVFPGDGLPGMAERSEMGALGTDVQLNHPTDLVVLPDGKVLVMAWHNHKLRQIDPATGRVRILSGAGAGFAGDDMNMSAALFKQPKALERDPVSGDLYILDQQNFRIRKIAADGMLTTIAGAPMAGFSGDGGPALGAQFGFEAGSNPEPSGGLTFKDNKVFVADTLNHRIREIDLATGMIRTIAGDGTPAVLNHPRDLEFGPDGDLYIADTDSNTIKALVVATGELRVVAGTGELGLDPSDDRPATQTKLARPFGIEFDPDGALYISDTINSRIVRVAP